MHNAFEIERLKLICANQTIPELFRIVKAQNERFHQGRNARPNPPKPVRIRLRGGYLPVQAPQPGPIARTGEQQARHAINGRDPGESPIIFPINPLLPHGAAAI